MSNAIWHCTYEDEDELQELPRCDPFVRICAFISLLSSQVHQRKQLLPLSSQRVAIVDHRSPIMVRIPPLPQPTAPPNLADAAAALYRRDLTAASVTSWSYLGCFSDTDSPNRILSAANDTQIVRNYPGYCCDLCTHLNTDYSLCGVEDGGQCFCDSTTYSDLTSLPASSCASTCPRPGWRGLRRPLCPGSVQPDRLPGTGHRDARVAHGGGRPRVQLPWLLHG